MDIEVRLFATLREGRKKKEFLEFEKNTTIQQVIKQLNINEEEVAILLKNGRDASVDAILVDGDVISIFPPVGGG